MDTESKGFINSDRLTRCVKYFLYAQILIALITIFTTHLEYEYLGDLKSGAYDSEELATMDAEASDARQSIVGLLYTINFIASAIVILKWIYRANYNARELGAKNMRFTPGWAIGFYFIPIATLWKPYQAMKEIWQASEYPKNWKSGHVSAILPLWWTLWIINNFLAQAFIRTALKAKEVDALMDANILQQIGSVFDVAIAVTFFFIVTGIHNNQTQAYARNIVSQERERLEQEELALLESEEFELPGTAEADPVIADAENRTT